MAAHRHRQAYPMAERPVLRVLLVWRVLRVLLVQVRKGRAERLRLA